MFRNYIPLTKKADQLTIWIETSSIAFVSELPEGGSRITYYIQMGEEHTDVTENHDVVMASLVKLKEGEKSQ